MQVLVDVAVLQVCEVYVNEISRPVLKISRSTSNFRVIPTAYDAQSCCALAKPDAHVEDFLQSISVTFCQPTASYVNS